MKLPAFLSKHYSQDEYEFWHTFILGRWKFQITNRKTHEPGNIGIFLDHRIHNGAEIQFEVRRMPLTERWMDNRGSRIGQWLASWLETVRILSDAETMAALQESGEHIRMGKGYALLSELINRMGQGDDDDQS